MREQDTQKKRPKNHVELTSVTGDARQEASKRPLNLKLISRLFSYTQPYAKIRNWLFLLVFIRAVQLPAIPFYMGQIIRGPVSEGDMGGVFFHSALLVSFILFMLYIFYWRFRLSQQLGERVVHDLRNAVFVHIHSMPMSYFDRTRLGRNLSRVTNDAEAVRVGVQNVLFVSLVQLGQMIVAAGMMMYLNLRLFLVILTMAPILYVIISYFRKKLSKAYREVQESFSRVTSTLAESVSGVRVTQGFARQDTNAHLFHNLVDDHAQYNMNVARNAGVFVPLLELNSQVFIAFALLVGGWQVFHSGMEPATFIPFFIMVPLFFGPIKNIGNQYNSSLSAMAGAERIFSLLDQEPDWQDPPEAIELQDIKGKVEFRDLCFAYNPKEPVIRNLSFRVEPGSTAALVGETGSGKSTIIKLVSKFYLPTYGELLIDDIDIRRLASRSLQHQLGIVLQDNFLFTGTVLDNIRYSRYDADEEEVIEVLRKLDCLDLMKSLPDGLATIVGEKGTGISLGQRQLICFARSLLADPKIMILDEATSSVDTITEGRIQRALAILLENRTSIIVAHRLSTIRHADVVLVMDQGRLAEHGSHEQLLARNGLYTRLYRRFVRSAE